MSLAILAIVITAASATPARTSASAPASRLRWIGRDWFLEGANLPWVHWRCDFGCQTHGGVLSS